MSILYQLAKPVHSQLKHKLAIIRLKKAARKREIKIALVANNIYREGWASTKQSYFDLLKIEDWNRFFNKASISAILAEHVWEHLTEEQGLEAARNCFTYLKKDGHLRVAVPDGYHPYTEYIDYVKPGGIGLGADDHKVLYDYKKFMRLFSQAGFSVNLLEYYDENGRFYHIDWKPEDGMIYRSRRFDSRNQTGELKYTSLIIDAVKRFE